MLNKQILERIETLKVRLEQKSHKEGGVPVSEEAYPLWCELQIACREAAKNDSDPEEAFCQLFFKAAGDMLARSNGGLGKDIIDLDVVERMALTLKKMGIAI